ncbi:MAG TPA: transposase [Acidimicrobiales bacterium]|nr:transposase [Acidimicrobiales bacterium]
MPKVYAAEFRQRAVALARSGRPIGQLATDLKVSEATLFRWAGRGGMSSVAAELLIQV